MEFGFFSICSLVLPLPYNIPYPSSISFYLLIRLTSSPVLILKVAILFPEMNRDARQIY